MQIRTDLAVEQPIAPGLKGVEKTENSHGNIKITRVQLESDEAAKLLGKPKGRYITFSMDTLYYAEPCERMRLSHLLSESMKAMLPKKGTVLVVGLGNRRITADALGSRVLDDIMITRHLEKEECCLCGPLRSVCAMAPGVLGVTGMETAEVIRGIVEHVKPEAVIAIDALAARESSRICTTIQLTDTGILPGSGVGNHRMGLNRDTLGVPVIAIGVPMVVYAAVIARDALSLMMEDLGIRQEEHEAAIESLIEKTMHHALGEMVVTPREVDAMVGRMARIIADGINEALQIHLSSEEIQSLTHDAL